MATILNWRMHHYPDVVIRRVPKLQAREWIHRGWDDLKYCGRASLAHGALIAILGAVLFGAANVVRRSAMPEVSSPIVGVTWSLFVTLLVSVILMALQRQRLSWNRGGPYFLLSGVFQAIGLVAVYSALASGHVSIVVPLYASSPIFVLALSPLVLGKLERLNRRIVLGVLTTLAGVTLISVFH